jgi:hypothetical protein
LTHQTTSASEMLEKTTCEIFCQKGPPVGGGTPGPGGTCPCRRSHRRHVAWRGGRGPCGSMPPPPLAAGSMPPPPLAAGPTLSCSMPPPHCMPPPSLAAGPTRPNGFERRWTCRQWQRRQGPAHVPRVAWPGVPPLVGQKFSQVVFSSISLAQVVSYVKNSFHDDCPNIVQVVLQ